MARLWLYLYVAASLLLFTAGSAPPAPSSSPPPDPTAWLANWQKRAPPSAASNLTLPRFVRPQSTPPRRSLIPPLIFQTWKSHTAAGALHQQAVKSFVRLNKDYAFHLFDDAESLEFMCLFHPDVAKIYQLFIPGAPKSDLFRLAILYTFGGVYVDTDTLARQPFREFVWRNASLVSGIDFNGELHQWIIMVSPRHPLIKAALALAASRAARLYLSRKHWKPASVIQTTGPGAFNTAILQALKGTPCGDMLHAALVRRRKQRDSKDSSPPPAHADDEPGVLRLPPCPSSAIRTIQVYTQGLSDMVQFKAPGVGGSVRGNGEMYRHQVYYHESERNWETLFRNASSADRTRKCGDGDLRPLLLPTTSS